MTGSKKTRGGRGCPDCGTHSTKLLGKTEQICMECGRTWQPCAPFCRGYLDTGHAEGPTVHGCERCEVPTRFARSWPEAWRALARELDSRKLEPVT